MKLKPIAQMINRMPGCSSGSGIVIDGQGDEDFDLLGVARGGGI